VHSVAFAAHHSVRWPLPLYELALLSAAHIESCSARDIDWKLVTYESAPLEVFGARASRAVADLLDDAGIEIVTRRVPHMARRGRLLLDDGAELEAERVVALPELRAPFLPGVPRGAGGFIRTDDLGRVTGLDRVFAAGDASSFPIKQGGLAAQQADTAAAKIAELAGASVEPRPPISCLGPRSSPAQRPASCGPRSRTARRPPPRAAASCGGRPARLPLATSLPTSPPGPRVDSRRRSTTWRRSSGRTPTPPRRIARRPSTSRTRRLTRTPAGGTTRAPSSGRGGREAERDAPAGIRGEAREVDPLAARRRRRRIGRSCSSARMTSSG
jgi:hypothetical protein